MGIVINVLWFRFRFNDMILIKRLLTCVAGTFLGIVYVHFSTSIQELDKILFMLATIAGIWYFELPMFKNEIAKGEDYEDILDA